MQISCFLASFADFILILITFVNCVIMSRKDGKKLEVFLFNDLLNFDQSNFVFQHHLKVNFIITLIDSFDVISKRCANLVKNITIKLNVMLRMCRCKY